MESDLRFGGCAALGTSLAVMRHVDEAVCRLPPVPVYRESPRRGTALDVCDGRDQRERPFIESTTDDAASDGQPGQALEVGQAADAARGDHGRLDTLGQGARGVEVRPLEGAVASDVRVDDPGQGEPLELVGQRGGVHPRGLEPTLRGDLALAGIEPQYQPAGVVLGHGPEPVRIAQRLRAHDDTIEPGTEPAIDRRRVANAAAELARHSDALEDSPNGLHVHRLSGLRPIEIDKVDQGRPFGLPSRCHRGWIVAKNRLLVVIPLAKTDAQSSAQVDRRDHSHGRSPKRQRSFNKHSMYPWGKGIASTECPRANPERSTLLAYPEWPRVDGRDLLLCPPGTTCSPAAAGLSDRAPDCCEERCSRGIVSVHRAAKFAYIARPTRWLFSGWNWQAIRLSRQTMAAKGSG